MKKKPLPLLAVFATVTISILVYVFFAKSDYLGFSHPLFGFGSSDGYEENDRFFRVHNYFMHNDKFSSKALISRDKCRIPEYPIWNKDAEEEKENYRDLSVYDCGRKNPYHLTYIDEEELVIDLDVLASLDLGFKDVSCCYRSIRRVTQNYAKFDDKADRLYKFSKKCWPLKKERTNVTKRFLVVHCVSPDYLLKPLKYHNFHAVPLLTTSEDDDEYADKDEGWVEDKSRKEFPKDFDSAKNNKSSNKVKKSLEVGDGKISRELKKIAFKKQQRNKEILNEDKKVEGEETSTNLLMVDTKPGKEVAEKLVALMKDENGKSQTAPKKAFRKINRKVKIKTTTTSLKSSDTKSGNDVESDSDEDNNSNSASKRSGDRDDMNGVSKVLLKVDQKVVGSKKFHGIKDTKKKPFKKVHQDQEAEKESESDKVHVHVKQQQIKKRRAPKTPLPLLLSTTPSQKILNTENVDANHNDNAMIDDQTENKANSKVKRGIPIRDPGSGSIRVRKKRHAIFDDNRNRHWSLYEIDGMPPRTWQGVPPVDHDRDVVLKWEDQREIRDDDILDRQSKKKEDEQRDDDHPQFSRAQNMNRDMDMDDGNDGDLGNDKEVKVQLKQNEGDLVVQQRRITWETGKELMGRNTRGNDLQDEVEKNTEDDDFNDQDRIKTRRFVKKTGRDGSGSYDTGPSRSKPDSLKITPRSETEEPIKTFDTGVQQNSKLPHVLIIGIDSTSRVNFRRFMKLSVRALRNVGAVEMKGFTKVGHNTLSNILPLLTSYSSEEIDSSCRFNDSTFAPFDDCYFIWKEFAALNYVTAHLEDGPTLNALSFVREQVDFNLRPLMMAAYAHHKGKRLDKGISIDCIGYERPEEIVLKFTRNLLKSSAKWERPTFTFAWLTDLTHRKSNSIKAMDIQLSSIIKELKKDKILDNTLFIMMSDHGYRFDPFRRSLSGWYEDKLPLLWIKIPRSYEDEYGIKDKLIRNSRKLITPYDLHSTLQHVLKINRERFGIVVESEPKTSRKGLSLLKTIPPRSCKEAHIPSEHCPCNMKTDYDVSSKLVWSAVKVATKGLNARLPPQCTPVKMKRVIGTAVLVDPNNMNSFKTEKNLMTGDTLIVLTVTNPGDLVIESGVKYDEDQDSFNSTNHVLRTNKGREASECIDRSHPMYDFCVCQLNLY